MRGIIKFFDDKKGYGFIINEETNKEIFVHFSSIVMEGYKTLREKQVVTYDEDFDEKNNKPRAINVVVVSE